MGIEISAASLSSFSSNLENISRNTYDTAILALREATEQIFNTAQSRVPVSTGALKSSGKITEEQNGNFLQCTISYGSSIINPKTHRATDLYASKVHETHIRAHPESYKWLYRSLQENAEAFGQIIASRIRQSL